MSLDGYIADVEDTFSAFVSDPAYDQAPFFASVDTALMGRRTYEAMTRHGARSIPGMRSYVFSRTLHREDFPEVTIVAEDAATTVAALRAEQAGKDIWLSGGGLLFRSLAEAGVVDTVEVGISPLLLGQGVPLLPSVLPLPRAIRLDLTHHEVYPSGLVVLLYDVRRGIA